MSHTDDQELVADNKLQGDNQMEAAIKEFLGDYPLIASGFMGLGHE